jgi:hypothetical protein
MLLESGKSNASHTAHTQQQEKTRHMGQVNENAERESEREGESVSES